MVQCSTYYDNKMWFVTGNENGLFSNDGCGSVSFEAYFNTESKSSLRLYTGIEELNGKLFFSPGAADRIPIYDIKTRTFIEEYTIDNIDSWNKYLDIVKINKNIYFIPYASKNLIKYSEDKASFKTVDGWKALRDRGINTINNIIPTHVLNENFLYFFMADRPMLIKMNLDDDTFELCEIEDINARITAFGNFGKDIYLVTDDYKLWNINLERDKEEKSLIGDFSETLGFLINRIFISNDYIYMVNDMKKNIGLYKKSQNSFHQIDMNENVADKCDDEISIYYYYDCKVIEKNMIALYSFYDAKYIYITDEFISKDRYEYKFSRSYVQSLFRRKEIIMEKDLVYMGMNNGGIELFLDSIEGKRK